MAQKCLFMRPLVNGMLLEKVLKALIIVLKHIYLTCLFLHSSSFI